LTTLELIKGVHMKSLYNQLVVIVEDQGRLRVQSMHDGKFIRFPNHLRTKVGVIYMVEELRLGKTRKHWNAIGEIRRVRKAKEAA